MAQVLPQSYGSHLLSKPGDGQDSTSLPVRDDQPRPGPFHFPAAPEDSSNDFANMRERSYDSSSNAATDGLASKKHTRKHMSLALPAFSFNPGASSDTEPGPVTPSTPMSPLSGPLHSSPSRGGRHRRIQSEFIGGDASRSPMSTRESSPMADEVTFRDLANDLPPVSKSPSKGHRHRRSGAISSQDLSSVASQLPRSASKDSKPGASEASPASPTFALPILTPNRPGAEYLRSANESPGTSKSSSPVRVSFAENIEVIPRRSLPSLRNQPILASARAIHSSDGPRATRPVSAPSRGHETRQSPLNTFGSWLADGSGVTAEPLNETESTTDDLYYSLPLEVVDEAPVEVDGEVRPSMPGTFSFPDNFEDSDEQFGEPGFATLSENLDNDPSSAEVYVHSQFSQPSAHFSEMRSSTAESSDSVVDLDTALELSESTAAAPTIEELRVLRSKSFSAARHSMHSSGWPPSVTSPLHRRTESAPSPPMPNFDRPTISRFNSASASEKGFEMENVFEEDEEVAEAEAAAASESNNQDITSSNVEEQSPQFRGPPQRSATSDTITPDSSPTKTSGTVKANKWLTETALRDSVSTITPDLLANLPGSSASDDYHDARSQPHSLMSSPPATPGTASGIWASSTCDDWATDGASAPYSEASSFVDCQQLGPPKANAEGSRLSSDGTPSLISSRSTMNSGPHRQGSNAASPHTLNSATLDGTRPSSGSSHTRWHKRSSIASLSRLMTGTGSTRSHLSMEYTPRCQTSDGLHDEARETKDHQGKRKRLGRLLKYFRPKDPKEQAPG